MNGPREEAELLEVAQPHGEHLRRSGRDEPLELGEPPRSIHELVEHDKRPLRSDHGQRALHRAVVSGLRFPELGRGIGDRDHGAILTFR